MKHRMNSLKRIQNEIEHGRKLSSSPNAEAIWGWDTPAGRLRAKRRAGLIISGAQLDSSMRVLEIGCGTGLFTEYFADTGAHILAVDVSPELLETARNRKRWPGSVEFRVQSFDDVDCRLPFDAVIGSSVLHHLDIRGAIKKIYQILKPGGMLSFAEPNMLNPQIFVERAFSAFPPFSSYVSPDETAFIKWKLRNLLRTEGFEEIVIHPFDWLHPSTPMRLIDRVHSLGRTIEKCPILREFSGSLIISARRPSMN